MKGIIVRDETVVYSEKDGYIEYYAYENQKVKKNMVVCSIKDSKMVPEIEKDLKKVDEEILKVQDQRKEISIYRKEIHSVQKQIFKDLEEFQNQFADNHFSSTYKMKKNLEIQMDKREQIFSKETADSLMVLSKQKREYENQLSQNSTYPKAPFGGLISYYIDDLEKKFTMDQLEGLTSEEMNIEAEIVDVSQEDTVKKGDPIYKIVNNYQWYIAGSVPEEAAQEWSQGEMMELRFPELDYMTLYAQIHSLHPNKEGMVVVFQCNRQLDPFIGKRNIEIEIIEEDFKGIKIPINAIVEKNFFKIPKEYIAASGKSKGIIRRKEGIDEFVPMNISIEDEQFVYILQDFSSLHLYDVILLPDQSNSEYIIKEMYPLQGIYIVNAGITKFRKIEILGKNKDYAIVKQNVPLGIRLYDQIISNTQNVEENQLMNQFQIREQK
jgi:hypothetical protein